MFDLMVAALGEVLVIQFQYHKEHLEVQVVVDQEVMDQLLVELETHHQHLHHKEMVVEVVTQILEVLMLVAVEVVLVALDLHHQDLVLSVEQEAVEFKF
ncbi:MAG: hypothetical protein EB114_12915 [Betaproteobacteria bacterium]|nr:hypothetical protein [Betaproteobacteria bacterium]